MCTALQSSHSATAPERKTNEQQLKRAVTKIISENITTQNRIHRAPLRTGGATWWITLSRRLHCVACFASWPANVTSSTRPDAHYVSQHRQRTTGHRWHAQKIWWRSWTCGWLLRCTHTDRQTETYTLIAIPLPCTAQAPTFLCPS